MKSSLLPLLLGLVVISGCATAPLPTVPESPTAWITPEQAILLAANAAPQAVQGTFAMKVQASGTQNNQTYLNSELDYRDQRCLTIALTPRAMEQLRERLGAEPLSALKGRNILVTGAAVRTRINFFAEGKVTDKYYYQTHVNVSQAAQIVIR